MKNLLLFLTLGLPVYGSCNSIAEPMLWSIRVWEYYKFENGAFRNYALVINPEDTDIQITILKYHGYYNARPTYSSKVSRSDNGDHEVTIEIDKKNISKTDSLRQGKLAIDFGDTLLTGLTLKRHEVRIIPDFFETYRNAKIYQVTIMVNGGNGGQYTLNKVTLPATIPSGNIIHCVDENTGGTMPYSVILSDNLYKPGKRYDVKLLLNIAQLFDTLQINLPEKRGLYKSLGLEFIPLEEMNSFTSKGDLYYKHFQNNKRGKPYLVDGMYNARMKDILLQIKTPKTNKQAFTGMQLVTYQAHHGIYHGYLIPIPMNIKL